MAYNPFNIFRRNQRALFAVITVFIMFTFVLSSGLGGGADFFDWLPAWLGKNKKGEHICTIDGDKVYEGDLSKLRFRRVMASRFMELAAAEAEESLQTTLTEKLKSVSPQFKQMLPIILQNPQFIESLLDESPNRPRLLTLTPDEKEALRGIQAYSAIQQARQTAMMQGRNFFVNAPNRNSRDLVEFLLWEKKADQMGIRFTEDDIKKLIQKEFFGQFANDVQVRRQMEKDMQGFSMEACLKAIGDEFRVRAAQTALLGPVSAFPRDDGTLTAPPLFTPPYDMYDFYRDQVSPTTYWVLSVPGANFADRVTGTPTDAELKALFDKYKSQEYDPAREEPGFRQPRRAKVEWVKATGEEPYYQQKAQQWVVQSEWIRKTEVGALAVPLPGIGPGLAATTVAWPAATEPLIWAAYQEKVLDHQARLRLDWEASQFVTRPTDTSVVRKENLAAAVGGAGGSLLAFGGPYQPFATVYGRTILLELRDRVVAGTPLFFAVPGPGLQGTLFGGVAGVKLGMPQPIPIDAYRPALLKQVTDDKARELAVADLRKLRIDLDAIAKDKALKTSAERTAKAREAITAFVKERGLVTGGTTDFRDEWTIEDDPGMAPLKVVAKPGGAADLLGGGNRPVQFGKKFFWTDDFTKLNMRDPRSMELIQSGNIPKAAAVGTFQPEFFPQEPSRLAAGDPAFLFWRTEEQQAKELTFDQAKNNGSLAAAWRRAKGRELAKARAEEIATRLRGRSATSGQQILQNLSDEEKVLRDEFRTNEKAEGRVKFFDIDAVAPLAPHTDMNPFGGGGKTVRPFRLEASANIPYPTLEMEKALLDERTKPPGTTLVLADRPKDTYYVAVNTKRHVLTPREFNFEVFSPMAGQSGTGRGIRQAYTRESAKDAHDSILALLKKEFEYVETDEQKKKLDTGATEDEGVPGQ